MRPLKEKIIVLDNVLTPNECKDIIRFYNKVGPTKKYRDTFVLSLTPNVPISSSVSKIVNAFNDLCKHKIDISWCEVVEWPIGSRQLSHIDDTDLSTKFTSITYLNDEYIGGKTFFLNDIEILPKTGRTVYFDGISYYHGVTPVENATRYTLPIWYE